MYLDHLRLAQDVTVAPSVSFSDVMQEAMYATEVCSAADAYLIKAEAEMMVLGSEAEGESEGGFWAKVKTVIRKIWEAIKNLANKIYIFIKSIPGKIMTFYQKAVMKSSLKNLPELWKKAKAEGRLEAAKDKGIKYLDLDRVPELSSIIITLTNPGNPDAVAKFRERMGKVRDGFREKMNDKDSVAWVDASKLKDDDVAEIITTAKSGELPYTEDQIIKKFEEGTKTLQKHSDAETKKYDTAYKNKDQEAAKKLTENLSSIRSLLVEHATCANFFSSVIFRAISSKAKAIKSIAGISSKE